jgi:hypothetical protein
MGHDRKDIHAMKIRRIAISALAGLLVAPLAFAQSLESRERTARTSCLTGDYAKGAAILSELFVDTRNPTFIYNQGRCFEQNRRFEEAIGRFEEYLRIGRNLGAEEVADAKKHIADCRQLLGEQANLAPRPLVAQPAPAPAQPASATVQSAQPAGVLVQPTSPPAQPGRGLRIAGIVVGAAGVAGVVTGVLLTLKARSMSSDMEKLDGYTPDKESSRKNYRDFGVVATSAGGVCLATGAVLYILGARAAAQATPGLALSPIIAPGAAGAAITGAF